MLKIINIGICLLIFQLCWGQAFKPPKKKKDLFGSQKIHTRNVGNMGIHLGLGPSFMTLARDNADAKNELNFTDLPGFTSTFDQKGKLSLNSSAHFVLFSKKNGWFSFGRLIDYYAFGLGFNYLRGQEQMTVTDAAGRDASNLNSSGEFKQGWLSGRAAIHKIIAIPSTKLFIDNEIGLHIENRVISSSESYSNYNANASKYTSPLIAQFNIGTGVGIQLGKGSYLIPKVYVPIFSLKDFNANSIHWFHSRYFPIHTQISWLYRFNKPRSKTNCTTPDKGPIPPPEGGQ